MYAVEVRDHILMAHSLPGEVFGPAQRLHGATYVVDVAFMRDTLSSDGIVVDIGRAMDVLKAALAPITYTNLDDLPQFKGIVTTTEFLCKYVWDQMVTAAHSGALGPGSDGLQKIRVTLNESHLARAWFEGDL